MKFTWPFSTAVLLLLLVGSSDRSEAATAFCYFTTSDGSYLNADAASSMADLVQVSIQNDGDNQWVARPEVLKVIQQLAILGQDASDEPMPLQLARWLRADIMVKGTFSLAAGDTWILDLEIIELQHADVLTRFKLAIEEQSAAQLKVSDQLVVEIAERVRQMWREAITTRDQMVQQTLIAPMHFQNTHRNNRLDFFEAEVQRKFSQQNKLQGKFRYLQFHKSQDAIADAVVADTERVDSNARPRSADHYIWGEYAEIESSGILFDQVTIEFTLHQWNGGDSHNQKSFRGTVGGRDQLLRQIIAYVESTSNSRHRNAFDENTCKQVAHSFYERAIDRRIHTIQPELRDARHLTKRWIRTWRETKRLLSLAVFFDSKNEVIRREFLLEHVRTDVPPHLASGVSKLRGLWDRHRLWSQYATSFDLNYALPTAHVFKERPGSTSDNRLMFRHFKLARLEATRKLLIYLAVALGERNAKTEFGDGESSNTTDAPLALLQEWQTHLTKQFLNQLSELANDQPKPLQNRILRLIKKAEMLTTSQANARMLDTIWPIVVKNAKFGSQTIRKAEQSVEADVGRQEEAESMLPATEIRAEAAANTRSPDTRDSEPKPALPLEPIADIRSVSMEAFSVSKWWFVQEVTALTYAGDRMWCAFEGQRMNATLAQGNGLFSLDRRTKKWQTWDGLNRSESRINCLLEVDNDLWVAFTGDDVCRMNFKTGRTQRFTPESGAPSQELSDLCHVGHTVFVAGGAADRGVLGAYDLNDRQWTQYELNRCEQNGKTFPCPRVQKLAVNTNWVAVFADYYGSMNQLFVHDRSDMSVVIDAGQIMQQFHPEFTHFKSSWRPKVHQMLWVENLLWIATSRGLICFDPAQQNFVKSEVLKYELTTMVHADDKLWFGACPFRGNGTLGNTEQHTSVLLFDLHTKKWMTQIPIPYAGHITTMHLQDDTLWIGPGAEKATTVAIDVSDIPDGSDQK